MALKLDPITGKLVEEEEDPSLTGGASARPPTAFEQVAGGGGGGGTVSTPGGTVIQFPGPPEESKRSEWSKTTTGPQETRKVTEKSPEVAAAEAKHAEALQAQREAEIRKHQAELEIAQHEAKAAQDKEDAFIRSEEQKRIEKEARAGEIASRMREAAEARDALAAAKATPEERSLIERVAMAFMLGMAQSSHLKAGGEGASPAYRAWQDAQEERKQRRLMQIQQSEEFARLKQTNLEGAQAVLAQVIHDEDLKNEVTGKKIEARLGTLAKQSKIPAMEAELAIFQAKQRAQEADDEIKRGQYYEAQITREGQRESRTSGGSKTTNIGGQQAQGPKPTESEAKLALYGNQMKRDLAVVAANPELTASTLQKVKNQDLASEATDKTAASGIMGSLVARGARWSGISPNTKYEGLTADEQKVLNAWNSAQENFVRMKTGAGMPETEARRSALENMPAPDDTSELMKQKFVRLDTAANEMLAVAAPAQARIAGGQAQAQAQPRPAPRPLVGKEKTSLLNEIDMKLRRLRKDDPERARWKAAKEKLLQGD